MSTSMSVASIPEERRIGIQIAAQETSQQHGLDVWEQAEGDSLLQIWMNDLFLLAILPGRQHQLARLVVHQNAAAFFYSKTLARHLFAIDQRQRQAIAKDRAEFLHKVEGQ